MLVSELIDAIKQGNEEQYVILSSGYCAILTYTTDSMARSEPYKDELC